MASSHAWNAGLRIITLINSGLAQVHAYKELNFDSSCVILHTILLYFGVAGRVGTTGLLFYPTTSSKWGKTLTAIFCQDASLDGDKIS